MDTKEKSEKFEEVSRQVEKLLRYYERGVIGYTEAYRHIIVAIHRAYEQNNETGK